MGTSETKPMSGWILAMAFAAVLGTAFGGGGSGGGTPSSAKEVCRLNFSLETWPVSGWFSWGYSWG